MNSVFTLSRKADRDISKITRWSLEQFGVNQTQKYMAGMRDSFEYLADNPALGRSYLNYFYFRYESHVIYYRKRMNDIFITRILHKKMLPERHIKG